MVWMSKLVGDFPENVRVNGELVVFDERGMGEVSEEGAEFLLQIPELFQKVIDVPTKAEMDNVGTPAAVDPLVTVQAPQDATVAEPQAVEAAPQVVTQEAPQEAAQIEPTPIPSPPKRKAPGAK